MAQVGAVGIYFLYLILYWERLIAPAALVSADADLTRAAIWIAAVFYILLPLLALIGRPMRSIIYPASRR